MQLKPLGIGVTVLCPDSCAADRRRLAQRVHMELAGARGVLGFVEGGAIRDRSWPLLLKGRTSL